MKYRNELRNALMAIAIGVVISSFVAMGKPAEMFFRIISLGAAVGFSIYVSILLLGMLFRPAAERMPEPRRSVFVALIYLLGGVFGWFGGGALLGHPVTPAAILREPWIVVFMLVTGGVAVIVGLVLRSFEKMTDRLAQREWAEKELEMARSIQSRLLPPPRIDGEGYTLAARNLPAHFVAGDFYDFVRLDDGSLVIVVADVAGKGMGASLIMASVKAVLPFVARGGVAETMRHLNQKLVNELTKREFVALVCARYVPAAGTLELANAGCPEPYLIRDGAQPIATTGTRLPLGLRRDAEYETLTLQLQRGDRVVFLTDGIPEAHRLDGELLGYDELAQIVGSVETAGEPLRGESWLLALLDRVRERTRPTLEDDWTAVVLDLAWNVAAVAGPSGSGKTTMIASLITHYRERGRTVGAIKHTHHPLNEERRGDTEVFANAGARRVILAGDQEAVVFDGGETRRVRYEQPPDLLRHFDCDIVLVEGFHDFHGWPRIAVSSSPAETTASILDRIWRP